MKCDDLVRSDIDTVVQAVEEQQQQQSAAAPVLPEQTSKKDKKKGKKPPKPAGIVDAGKDNKGTRSYTARMGAVVYMGANGCKLIMWSTGCLKKLL